jgi:hypothetical protein
MLNTHYKFYLLYKEEINNSTNNGLRDLRSYALDLGWESFVRSIGLSTIHTHRHTRFFNRVLVSAVTALSR